MFHALDVAHARAGRENVDWRGVWGEEVMVLIPFILGSTFLLPRARGPGPPRSVSPLRGLRLFGFYPALRVG
jgi:hypothetical protein